MMKRTIQAFVLCATMLFGVTAAAQGATSDTYDTYSRMFARSAAQYWSGNQVGGQWAWSPQSSTESWIYWGDPATWPPAYHERFLRVGDWVMLDGWWDNGTYYTDRVSSEYQAASDCTSARVTLPVGGAQHYTHWTIPAAAYCLYAEGTISEQSTGNSFHYRHKQIWSTGICANAYNPAVACLTQHEEWSDDHGSPMTLRLIRDGALGKGYGPAWNIRQTYPSVWSADTRYAWTW